MATVQLRKVIKFKSQKPIPKIDLRLKKIQQIHQIFQEEICVFQTVEFQNLHNTMTRSRKKLFAEWGKTLKQIAEFESRLKNIEKRMENYENNAKESIENRDKKSNAYECDKDLFDCIAIN